MVVMVIVLSRWTLRMSSLGRTDLETVDLYLEQRAKEPIMYSSDRKCI